MEKGGERWFVHFRGHSLGPISTEQLKTSLRTGEIGLSDKVASSKDTAWRPLSTYPEFSAYLASLAAPRLRLDPPPPPSILLKKKPVPAPAAAAAPVVPPAPAPESQSAPAPSAKAEAAESKPPRAAKKSKKKRSTKKSRNVKAKAEAAPAEPKAPETAKPNGSPLPERPPLKFPKASAPMDPTIPVLTLLSEWRNAQKATQSQAEPARPAAEKIKILDTPAPAAQASALPQKNAAGEVKLVIHLSLNKKALLVLGLLVLILGGGFFFWNGKKTRDLKDSRLPDPSSPTITPSTPGDPFPALKAPTHPRRD